MSDTAVVVGIDVAKAHVEVVVLGAKLEAERIANDAEGHSARAPRAQHFPSWSTCCVRRIEPRDQATLNCRECGLMIAAMPRCSLAPTNRARPPEAFSR